MDEFKVIIVMNEALLRLRKTKGEDCTINLKIKECLKDEGFFFRTDKSNAYNVIKNVGVRDEQIEEVYKKLTTSSVFYNLLYRGIIKSNDENLVVKYKTYRK
ncbi:MAG: hypothetical protein HFJ17_01800 [Clostridia bacterium]|nr:hypothetical protein [Clostridia bacterium]